MPLYGLSLSSCTLALPCVRCSAGAPLPTFYLFPYPLFCSSAFSALCFCITLQVKLWRTAAEWMTHGRLIIFMSPSLVNQSSQTWMLSLLLTQMQWLGDCIDILPALCLQPCHCSPARRMERYCQGIAVDGVQWKTLCRSSCTICTASILKVEIRSTTCLLYICASLPDICAMCSRPATAVS
jgi:hypothetical protein